MPRSLVCLGVMLGAAAALAVHAHAAGQSGAPLPQATPAISAGNSPAPGNLSAASSTAPDPRAALLKLLPVGSKLDDLHASPIAGIYEFAQGAEVSYLTADGKYFIDGNVYDMQSRENLTENLRTRARLTMINAVPESQMLIFAPASPKYTITVFTDVDCQYCRKLHSEIQELNRMGVRVRYMFFPRSGPNTESWRKAEVVWCSANRNETFTRAKTGAALDMSKVCSPNPVAREYALGESIGVHGTPAIVTENGDYIAGYLPPKELVAQLKELQHPGR